MQAPTIVNRFGTMTGWSRVAFNWFGRDVEGITSIEYDDNVEWENVYGAGRMPIGEGEGNYTAKASVELNIEEVRAMAESLPSGMRLQDVAGTIVVMYEYGTRTYTDIIHNVRIQNRGVSTKQNDKTITHKYDLKVSHITWSP